MMVLDMKKAVPKGPTKGKDDQDEHSLIKYYDVLKKIKIIEIEMYEPMYGCG